MSEYYYKYRKYKILYLNSGGGSECTTHRNDVKKCLSNKRFNENGKEYGCSYKKNGVCYRIASKNIQKIHE